MERVDALASIRPPADNGPSSYLGHLLRTALGAPGARTSSIAGRVIAVLAAAVVAQGDELVPGAYLSPDLRDGATFTVRRCASGDSEPFVLADRLGVSEALALAGSADGTDHGAEVTSHGANGLTRSVLSRSPGGELIFRFPDATSLSGEPALCAEALQRWEDALARWEGDSARQERALGDEPADSNATPEPADVLRDALADLTVRVDLGEVAQVVNTGLTGVGDEVTSRLASALQPVSAHDLALALAPLMPTATEVADLVTERVTRTIRDDLRRIVPQLDDHIRHVVAESAGSGCSDVANGDADHTASLTPTARPNRDMAGVPTGRSETPQTRPRRRVRQANGSRIGPWATGPTEG